MFTNLNQLKSLEHKEINKEKTLKEKNKIKIQKPNSRYPSGMYDWDEYDVYGYDIIDRPFDKRILIKSTSKYPFFEKQYLDGFHCENCINFIDKTTFCINKEIHVLPADLACINYITSLTT